MDTIRNFRLALTALIPFALAAQPASPTATFPTGRFYAPYILLSRTTPDLPRIAADSGIRYFTLAFIIDTPKPDVADKNAAGQCLAAWGGRTPLAQESTLAPVIDSLRQQGGDVLISFGGEAGKELALGCDTPTALQAQYQAVVDKYKATVLDLDIEGEAIKDSASVDRRNSALAALQTANPTLQVSYTLPVATTGLTPAGIALLNNAMTHGVRIAVVNIMTMDYGGQADPFAMGTHAITAANGTAAQMLDNGVRARIGIIPMIGINDTKPESFTLSDAQLVEDWAQANPVITRMSMWAVSRDAPCPDTQARPSNSCSGVPQQPYEFSKIFRDFH